MNRYRAICPTVACLPPRWWSASARTGLPAPPATAARVWTATTFTFTVPAGMALQTLKVLGGTSVSGGSSFHRDPGRRASHSDNLGWAAARTCSASPITANDVIDTGHPAAVGLQLRRIATERRLRGLGPGDRGTGHSYEFEFGLVPAVSADIPTLPEWGLLLLGFRVAGPVVAAEPASTAPALRLIKANRPADGLASCGPSSAGGGGWVAAPRAMPARQRDHRRCSAFAMRSSGSRGRPEVRADPQHPEQRLANLLEHAAHIGRGSDPLADLDEAIPARPSRRPAAVKRLRRPRQSRRWERWPTACS